jgi:hypothetical protein
LVFCGFLRFAPTSGVDSGNSPVGGVISDPLDFLGFSDPLDLSGFCDPFNLSGYCDPFGFSDFSNART